MRLSRRQIKKAVLELREGNLVVMPTETVYGLAADVFNETAVRKIFKLKNRPLFDPLIIHIFNQAQLKEIAVHIPPLTKKIIKKFWPGPLTVILPKSPRIASIVTAGLPTAAVRMPRHPIARELLKQYGHPLAAPSANRFGRISPTSAKAVLKEFGKRTPFLLDGGDCQYGLESTIIRTTARRVEILRPGSISKEELKQATGAVVQIKRKASWTHPEAPGLLKKHYSPHTKLRILPQDWRKRKTKWIAQKKVAFLLFQNPLTNFSGIQALLSKKGSLKEAAHHLYACLRKLDESGVKMIYAEPVPEKGIGRSINDRLKKAVG